jgi:hypothetical protein
VGAALRQTGVVINPPRRRVRKPNEGGNSYMMKKGTRAEKKSKYKKKPYTPPKNKIKIDGWSQSLIDRIEGVFKVYPEERSTERGELLSELCEIGKVGGNLELICREIEFDKNRSRGTSNIAKSITTE